MTTSGPNTVRDAARDAAPARSPFDPLPRQRLPRWLLPAVGAALLLALGWLLWRWVSDQAGVRREAPSVPTIVPLPPPPPPPPPKPQEPEKKVEDKVVAPEPKPMEPVTPKVDAPPKPANVSDPMQMDADAQAGGDAFNIGTGSGSGMGSPGGSGRAGTGTYGQYLAYALQQVLQSDDRTRRLVFRLSVDIWLDEGGKPTQVQLVQSSGNSDTDAAVLAALRAINRLDERPTPGLQFPARVVITGRRPS